MGVSTDAHDTQCRFASSLGAPFPIIGDHDRSICRAYDVLWPIVGLARRITYVVGPGHDGPASGAAEGGRMVIEAAFHHEVDISAHRDDVLRFVDHKLRARRPSP